jgi:hypothetical protein
MRTIEELREQRRLAQRRFRAAHPVEALARERARRERNRGKINEQRRALYAANPEKFREQKRRQRKPIYNQTARVKRYGITLDQYEEMMVQQEGRCAVCHGEFGKRIHIDHCHNTNVVRGLLCNGCNVGIGHLGDNPERMEAAAQYVRAHRLKLVKEA